MSLAMVLYYCFLLYVIAGLCIASAFVIFGVSRVLPMSATVGARLFFLPGAAVLWPYVLYRWLTAGAPR